MADVVELYQSCPGVGATSKLLCVLFKSGVFGAPGFSGQAKFSSMCSKFSLRSSPYSSRVLPNKAISVAVTFNPASGTVIGVTLTSVKFTTYVVISNPELLIYL